jgi:FMN-dependent NADH-azoreductase
MKQILVIESSPRGAESASRQLTQRLTKRLRALYPEARLIERDLAKDPLPHLDSRTVKAIFTRDRSDAESLQEALRLSDQVTEEVLSSDLLIIASPMWNFGLPSSLKAWVDHIVRPGKTFRYTAGGAEGLAREKKAILVLASGGIFTQGPWKSWDTEEPYLRLILSFIGITDVQTVRAQGMNIPGLSDNAILDGEKSIESLAL